MCVLEQLLLNETTFDLRADIWHAGSSWHFIGQVSRPRSKFIHAESKFFLVDGCSLRRDLCVLNRQRTARNVHTTLTRFKTLCSSSSLRYSELEWALSNNVTFLSFIVRKNKMQSEEDFIPGFQHLANSTKHRRRLPFRPICSIMWKRDVIHNIGNHSLLHWRQRRTEPPPQVTNIHKILWNLDMWFARGKTDKQTNRHTDHNTSPTYWGRSKNNEILTFIRRCLSCLRSLRLNTPKRKNSCVCYNVTISWYVACTHSGTSSSISDSPIPLPITSSSSNSPLCISSTPSLFQSRLKTYVFQKSYHPSHGYRQRARKIR